MKTIIKGKDMETIKRVSDSEAQKLVLKGYRYIPKSTWKEQIRNKKPSK